MTGPMIIEKVSLFIMKLKQLTSAHSLVDGCKILRNAKALESSLCQQLSS